MDKKKALESILQITNCTLGYVPSTPAEFNKLSLIILQKTQSHISSSSIKRLWGYVKYDSYPSRSTLNTLARFNGFKDWDAFICEISNNDSGDPSSSSAFHEDSLVNAGSLNIGDKLIIRWKSNKSCTLEYISYLRFKVISARNIKLQRGDTATIHSVCIGLPLFVSNIQRDTSILPLYIGAKNGGVTSIDYRPVS